MSEQKVKIIFVFCDVFENCAKSQFWSDRDGGHVSAPISPAAILHIISTVRQGRLYESFPLPLYYS